jgi:hypothetical protein
MQLHRVWIEELGAGAAAGRVRSPVAEYAFRHALRVSSATLFMPGRLKMRSNSRISPHLQIFLISLAASLFVLVVSLSIQWLVYDDWLRRTGPLRIVGTSIAAILTLIVMLRWQYSIRKRQREMIHRFELISHMNDRIRNALQAIECVTYISQPEATEAVKQEVNAIDGVLREVLSQTGVNSANPSEKDPLKTARKSA